MIMHLERVLELVLANKIKEHSYKDIVVFNVFFLDREVLLTTLNFYF
jgi:hypothetical protein